MPHVPWGLDAQDKAHCRGHCAQSWGPAQGGRSPRGAHTWRPSSQSSPGSSQGKRRAAPAQATATPPAAPLSRKRPRGSPPHRLPEAHTGAGNLPEKQ